MTPTDYPKTQGYSVLRFWNDDALMDSEVAVETILASLEARSRGFETAERA